MTNYPRAFYYLQTLLRQAYWSRERIEALQNKRLRSVVRYAYSNCPFYRQWFDAAGVRPADISSAEDLNRLPVIRKEEFVTSYRDFVSREFDFSKLRMSRTSGSTGKPKLVWRTNAEDELRKAKHLRAQIALGQRPWHKWVMITTPSHFGETTKLQRTLRFFGTIPFSVFEDVNQQVGRLKVIRPDVIDGFSSSVLLIARELKRSGYDGVNPRFLVSGADLIDADSRGFIEKVFDAPLYDQYATIEFERIAWQCKQKRDYHIDADTLVAQFLDENGDEVASGEEGEIVCTSLFNYAMPLIRYALDDIGVPSDEQHCECGRNLPLMKVIAGRKCMLIPLPGGRVLAPLAFTSSVLTFRLYSYIDVYRIVQKKIDLILFRFKLREKVDDLDSFKKEFVAHVRNMLNLTEDVAVEVEIVDDIPLDDSGKFQLVFSEVGNNLEK